MKTEKQIRREYQKYKILDNPDKVREKGLYQGSTPMVEWAYHQDKGFKKALEWVLGIKRS